MKLLLLAMTALLTLARAEAVLSWSDPSPHKDGFVRANNVQLEYLDWGGSGPTLIFIHGFGDNPHVFDDLAPAFTSRFHVIAYARRGHGRSDAVGPYDTTTLREDLRGLMDALNVQKADLVGWSMGGNEITALAGKYPGRVGRLVYLDGAYDWGDPGYQAAFKAIPASLLDTPSAAMASLSAYRSYRIAVDYTALANTRTVEAYLRECVLIEPDGTLDFKIPKDASKALLKTLLTDRRDYRRVQAPVLALYAESMFDLRVGDPQRRQDAIAWEREYMVPFRRKSIERIQREIAHVEVIHVPGAHDSFFLTSREQVVAAMMRFLTESKP